MAFFNFECKTHGKFSKLLSKPVKEVECPKCGVISPRMISAGTVRVTEKIDTGLMGRAIEKPVNQDDMINERNQKYKDNQKGDKII